jgi:hypothetical protein
VWQQGGHPQNEGGPYRKRAAARAALRKRGGPKGGPSGRQAGPGGPSGRPSGQVAARRAAQARPKGGQSRARGRPTGPPSRPDHSVCEMRGQLENGLRGPNFAHFFWRVRERCTFPAAPWPSAASPGSPAPPARKSHHLPDTGSYLSKGCVEAAQLGCPNSFLSVVYSPPFPCLTVVGRERGAGTSSTQIVVRARE